MDWLSRLKEMKNTSGKTTKEIADLSGVPEPTLEKLFAGNTRDPRLNTICAVVHCMGYTLDDLVPSEDIKKEPSDITASELSENERIFMSLPPDLRQEALRYMRYPVEQEGKR